MKTKTFAVTALIAVVALTGCSNGNITDKDIADALIPMTHSTSQPTQAQGIVFCKSMLQHYGEYGAAVNKRAELKSKEGDKSIKKEDLLNTLVDEQCAIQKIEDLTFNVTVSDDKNLTSSLEKFHPESTNVIDTFNEAKKTADTSKIDTALGQWEQKVQPVVMQCANG